MNKFKFKNKKSILIKFMNNILSKKNKNIIATLLLLTSFYLLIGFISFLFEWRVDDSIVSGKDLSDVIINDEIQNLIGGIGAYTSNLLIKNFFGITAFIIPLLIASISLRIFGVKKINLSNLFLNSLILILYIPVCLDYLFDNIILSGKVGIYLNILLDTSLGKLGKVMLLITIFIIYLIVYMKIDSDLFDLIKNKLQNIFSKIKYVKKIKDDGVEKLKKENAHENEDDNILIRNKEINNTALEKKINKVEKKSEDINVDIDIKSVQNEEKLSKSEIEQKIKELGDYDPTLDLSEYKMPKIELLEDHGGGEIKIDKIDLEDKKNKIVETLGYYNIGIASISATVGPTITLYEIVPEAGVRISKIKNLEDDIALGLAAEGIRIIAPIPGKGTIGIEVPNKNKTTVSMLEVLSSEKFQNSDMELPIAFGKTISNETYVTDLAKMPHLLMAGATGQGKSVGLNAVLASLLFKKHPSQVKFVLVDPKKVELTLFNKIERHFLAKLPDEEDAIITDTKKVIATVNSLCIEMDERYELCKTANCRNIKEYNKKFISRKLNPNKGHRYLPYIILVIDEFADLIMTAGKEIETPIARLAQLARAIGIHLIIATQRPSVNVITGLIKANFPTRAAFRVTSSIDSRTIMDSKGAEQLIGMGDMLISTGSNLIRLQCAFIDTPEVEKICEYIGAQRAYPDAHMLPEFELEGEGSSSEADLSNKDALFEQAALMVVQHQSGSTSLIQRKLRLGYNRAGRIIDQLEAAGVVGGFEGSKARKVLIKDEVELTELLKNLNNEL